MTDAATANDSAAGIEEAKKKRQRKPKRERQPFFIELSRLMVVAIKASSGQLVYKAQVKPTGPWPQAADWTPVDTTHTYSEMAAGVTGDGRVAVVAQAASPAALFFIDEALNAVGTEKWIAPVSLGMPAGVDACRSLAMAYDVDARLEVFAVANSGSIWWKYQNPNRIVQKTVQVTPPGTHTPITVTVDEIAPPLTPWSDWMLIPGNLNSITALRNADGRIILFGINANGNLYRLEQKAALALQPADWVGWTQMNDKVTGIIRAMAAARDSAGAVNLFGISQGHQVLHARQAPPNSFTWTGWTSPGFLTAGVHALAVGADGDNRLVLLATDNVTDQPMHLMNAQRDVAAQRWSGWMPVARASGSTQIALESNADGRLTLFSYVGKGGELYCTSQMADGSTEWEFEWAQLASGDIRRFAVVRDPTPPAS